MPLVASQTPPPAAPAAERHAVRVAAAVAVAAASAVAAAVAADTAATALARCTRFPALGAAASRASPSSLAVTSPFTAATASAPRLGDGEGGPIAVGTRVSFPYGGSRRTGTVADVSMIPDQSGGPVARLPDRRRLSQGVRAGRRHHPGHRAGGCLRSGRRRRRVRPQAADGTRATGSLHRPGAARRATVTARSTGLAIL